MQFGLLGDLPRRGFGTLRAVLQTGGNRRRAYCIIDGTVLQGKEEEEALLRDRMHCISHIKILDIS